MQFPQLRPGMKLALAVYAGARLLDLARGGKWNGGQREMTALVHTLPPLLHACDQLLVAATAVRDVLAPTFTPVRSRRHGRNVTGRRRGIAGKRSHRGMITPIRLS